jgi:hypothetical protein
MAESTISELLQACREAEAWCAFKSVGPAYRAEVLRPSVSELPAVDELHNVLETIRRRRRDLLASNPIPQSTCGRLLACEFNSSIASGESEHASGGFFDIDDRPPWDTWVWVLQSESGDPILLAWVPQSVVDHVEAGITMNPYGCIYWLEDAPPDVARLPSVRAIRTGTVPSA